MPPTQIPIIGSKKRYLTIKEATALQGLSDLKHLPSNTADAFKAIGNTVNSRIVREIAFNAFL